MQLYHAVALLAAASAVLAASLSVETPTTSIIAGVPFQIKWSGGSGPYTLVINTFENGAQTGVVKSDTGANSPYTYTPPSKVAGKALQFDVTDSTGALGQSGGTAKIIAGSGGSGGSGSGSGGSASASSSSSPSSGAASSSESGKSSAAASSSSAPSSSSSSSTSPANTVRVASAAVAGVVGVAAAALL